MKLILPVTIGLISLSNPAGAQTLRVPVVEVGVQGGFVGAAGDGIFLHPIFGPRLTVNLSQQHAIELSADTLVPFEGSEMYGLYFVQYKHAIRRSARWSFAPFFTAGAGGYFEHDSIPEYRSTRPDGSVLVYPHHSEGELSGFNLFMFGGGLEQALGRHASFRLEGGGFAAFESGGFFGFRVLAGVTLPMGAYRAN